MNARAQHASPADIETVRQFFARKETRDVYIASYVGKACDLGPLPTLRALADLLESGEITAHVSGGGLYWAFSRNARP